MIHQLKVSFLSFLNKTILLCSLDRKTGWATAWPVLMGTAQDPEGTGTSPAELGGAVRKKPLGPHSDPDQLPTLPPPSPLPKPECWDYNS